MRDVPRLEAQDPAHHLEDRGLQHHDEDGAGAERRAEQDAGEKGGALNAEFDDTDGDAGKPFSHKDHERVAGTAAHLRHHVEDRRKRAKGLANQ